MIVEIKRLYGVLQLFGKCGFKYKGECRKVL